MSVMPGLLVRVPRSGRASVGTNLVSRGRTALQHRGLPAATGRGLLTLGLAAAVLLVGQALLKAGGSTTTDHLYTVAAVGTNLARQPGAWIGRTIRVRAVAGNRCVTWMDGSPPACISWQPVLLGTPAPSAEVALPLRGAPQPPLLAALRRLPLVSQVVPAPQRIEWGALTTYRVRLRNTPTRVCGAPPCYEALLLDAAPSSLWGRQP